MKSIIGICLVGEAPLVEDQERNTDLIVLRLEAKRVACRVRRHEYLARYPNDITIRAVRPGSGNKTEIEKVVEGFGDYVLYGFGAPVEEQPHCLMRAWLLGDLNVFRGWYSKQLEARRLPGRSQINGDGSSSFRAFDVRELPENFIVARREVDWLQTQPVAAYRSVPA
ncbi:MAG: hypothetical protein ACRENL_05225 [Candidatus Dormibacteria bacterium]